MKGNVVDLAIGVVVGGAFGKIVTSLVNDIVMPIFGLLLGGINLANYSLKYHKASINYGNFLQTVLNFAIIAVSIFIFVKMFERLRHLESRKQAEAPPAPPAPTKEEQLLTEIRDLLKQNGKSES